MIKIDVAEVRTSDLSSPCDIPIHNQPTGEASVPSEPSTPHTPSSVGNVYYVIFFIFSKDIMSNTYSFALKLCGSYISDCVFCLFVYYRF